MANSFAELFNKNKTANKEVPTFPPSPPKQETITIPTVFPSVPSTQIDIEIPDVVVVDRRADDVSVANNPPAVDIAPVDLPKSSAHLPTAAEFHFPTQPDNVPPDEVRAVEMAIETLQAHITNPDMVKQAVIVVRDRLRAYPQFNAVLRPEHIGLFVQGVRIAYERALVTKDTRKTKKKARTELDEKLDQIAGDLVLEFN